MTVGSHRTSVSLEDHVWDGLAEICRREGVGIDALCTEVDRRRVRSTMSSALRVLLLLYFRSLADAVDDPPAGGHDGAGHLDAALDRLRSDEASPAG